MASDLPRSGLDNQDEILGRAEGRKPAPAQQKTRKKISKKTEVEQEQRRLEGWAMLDAVRHLLPETRTASCYRLPVSPTITGLEGVEVRHVTREDGTTRARYGNLAVCGSVWACPICAERIARERAAEVDRVLKAHRAGGGRLMFVTLTHRHHRDHKLEHQLSRQADALKALQEGRAYKALCRENGVLGMIRGLEMTWSNDNGWHVHIHFLVLLAGNEGQAKRHAAVLQEMDRERAARLAASGKAPRQKAERQPVDVPRVTKLVKFGRDLISQWQGAAKRAGLVAVRDAQQAVIASDDDTSLVELARYLTKNEWDKQKREYVGTGEDNVQEFGTAADHRAAVLQVEQAGQARSTTSSAAHEITMSQSKKSSTTPMGMLRTYTLDRIPKADTPERRAQDRRAKRMGALFAEYVRCTKGRAALVWGQGLRRMYEVEEISDQQAAEREEPTQVDRSLMLLDDAAWDVVLAAPRGTRGKLLEVARGGHAAPVWGLIADLAARQGRPEQAATIRQRATQPPRGTDTTPDTRTLKDRLNDYHARQKARKAEREAEHAALVKGFEELQDRLSVSM